MRQLKTLCFLLLLIGGYQSGYAQLYFPEDMVKVTAQIRDDMTGNVIPYVNVINQRIRGGTMADKEGKFSLQADPSDTLTFKSIGYLDKKVPVSELMNKEGATVTMAPVRYLLDGAEVTAEGPKVNMTGVPKAKMSKTPSELRGEFDKKPGVLTAIFHPTSFLYYKLSKDEKEKRNTLAAIRNEREWQLFSLVYNKEVASKLTGLKGDELDKFMVYFNAYCNLSFNSNSYEVEKRIRELYKEYKSREEELKVEP